VRRHLPIIDFRPYAIGTNINKDMEIPPDAARAVFEDTWIYKVNGKEKEFSTDEKPWNIEGATYVDRITKTIEEAYVPPIHDFTMERNGKDLTDELLQEEKLMLAVMYNLNKTKKKGLKRLKKVTDRALQNGYRVYAFSASAEENYLNIREEYQFDFDLLFCDETTLKTMIRANPGIIILNKGTIVDKRNWRDFKKIKFKD
jgi:endo-alpha-1,4-polygalactosaminidase (GH114 family)